MTWTTLWTLLWIGNYAGVVVLSERLLRWRWDPRGAVAWIFAMLLLPFLGLLLFVLVGPMPMTRKVRRRLKRRRIIAAALEHRAGALEKSHSGLSAALPDPKQLALMKLATRITGQLVTRGNEVTVYTEAEKVFLALSLAIEAAHSHVHLEYYIFWADDTGRAMADLLIKKARQGVEVRLLLDAVGCWKVPRAFFREMTDGGVKVSFFLTWGPTTRRFNINCRNHRKLVVVDGITGFLGSHNIGDEYLGRKRRKFGLWRDTHLRVAGTAVTQLQEAFVEDWHFATGEDLSDDRYFPAPAEPGASLVQIIPTGPDRPPDTMHQLLFAAVNDAQTSIAILTPYFVPDPAMTIALRSAAYRGVRVQLLLPSKSDHWWVLWAGRASYPALLSAGIEVYEFDKGMLHSKVVVVDSRWALVGSANMDERSFRLNFELTSALYDKLVADVLMEDFEALRASARRIYMRDVDAWSYRDELAAGLARLTTPLL